MVRLESVSTREEISDRIREIVVEQMAASSLEVGPGDSLDADFAGDVLDEILSTITEDFGTDFSELSEYRRHSRSPEGGATGVQVIFAIPLVVVFFFVTGNFYREPLGWEIFAVVLVPLIVWCRFAWKSHTRRLKKSKLRLTIDDLVDAAINGRWEAPEEFWDRIGR